MRMNNPTPAEVNASNCSGRSSAAANPNVVIDDVAAAVQAEVDMLERKGVNKIILISHLQDIDADLALAPQLTGVDIMVAGGGDELLANPGDLLVPGDDVDEIFGPYPLVAIGGDDAVIGAA